ncbi:MAG: DNA topoisomerase IB [Bacteroidota bacterium]
MERSVEIIEAITPSQYAKEAGLRYVNDETPGLTRRREGEGFLYLDKESKPITDERTIKRIQSLNIPPAWENVWICPSPNGHLQATGVDSRGRKQYRYHAEWQKVRSTAKFNKMQAFGESLSRIREEMDKDLKKPLFSRDYVLATVATVLDNTHIRIGNDCYEKDNRSYGLTTLRNKHVTEEGKMLKFSFVGKKGVVQEIYLTDKKLSRIVKKCREIPGYRLFQYYDEAGNKCQVSSEDVNSYLRDVSGLDLTAKDFRTWGGSVEALKMLAACEPTDKESEIKKNVVEAVKSVAQKLGNTPAVCRNYYIHPLIVSTYTQGKLQNFVEANEYIEQVESERLSDDEKLFIKLLNDPPK